MDTLGKIIKGKYFDSVSLMRVSKRIAEQEGIEDSSIVMGTHENKAILQTANLWLPLFEGTGDNDLLVAIKGKKAAEVITNVDAFLEELRPKAQAGVSAPRPKSLSKALELMPEANLAIISIAGKYAPLEVEKALDNKLHVMLFSDNVSLDDEIRLKKIAQSKGLLLMGPDCGTAIINGTPLAFANVVNRGNIGMVAASGTGLQEVSTLISNMGGGISQAIGTGGRDVKKEVGGIMFIEGIRLLAQDPQTEVICLVSKPPHPEVMKKIAEEVKIAGKPCVAIFLGANPKEVESFGIKAATTLFGAAQMAVELTGKRVEGFEENIVEMAKEIKAKIKPEQKYIRALFSGGTFASETQLIWQEYLSDIYSNAPTGSSLKLENNLISQKHSVVDLGEDEFTVGRPHPMIDFSMRVKQIKEEANNPEVAIILLDIVLGFGSNMDPLSEVKEVIQNNNKKVCFVASVTGTEADPQMRSKVVAGLREVGVYVLASNAQASELAAIALG